MRRVVCNGGRPRSAGTGLRRVAAVAVVLMAVPIVSLGLAVGNAAASGNARVTDYTDPSINFPLRIAAGSDGALWFTNTGSIGRISTSGTVTTYSDPDIDPYWITAGPDGALWFTNVNHESIGRITTSGTITTYPDPSIDSAYGITTGPDGALWFTNVVNDSIGRITTTGTVTHYTDPSIVHPTDIAAGPDGALWFTNDGANSIGRITTTGTVTHYTDPSIEQPYAIAAGPDGALWFTNEHNDSIGRITTTGTITHYSDPSIDEAIGITAGPDGAMWFANENNNSIGRITTSGTITRYTDPSISLPAGIAAGSDGALWFVNSHNNSIGRIILGEPLVVPGSGAVVKGSSGTIDLHVPVTLSNPWTQTVTARWRTVFVPGAPANQADPTTDYTPASGTVTFAPGATAQTVTISINGDTLVEPDEYIVVQFGDPTNATMGGYYGLGFGSIDNNSDDRVVPGAGSVLEGNSGTTDVHVPVTLSIPSGQTVTARWRTVFVPGAPANQADPTTDYTPASGTVTFAPGATAQTVTISINGDTLVEPDEYIVVQFGDPTNATMGGYYGLGFGVITNDD
jgi:virginiamycin B lyase